ncbi:TonB-dependent receptor [Chitinophagaceae bacterium LWZ2-11]
MGIKQIRFILINILLISFGIQANAQQPITVTGTIVDENNTPIINATVTLKTSKISTVTNIAGLFILQVQQGRNTLIVSHVGMDTEEVKIDVKANQTTNVPTIKMHTHSSQLDDVVVTGQYAPQSMRNSVYKIRTITKERIQMRAATDVLGVLNNEFGIRFSTDYTLGETDVNIMGMSGQNVKILLDGIPLIDRGSTKQSLSQIDINTIERIEIVEGPMSVVYGTDALAGVINIITKKGTGDKSINNISVSAKIQEETVADYYSPFANDGIHYENITLGWQNKSLQATGYVTRNNFGGWKGNADYRAKDWNPKDQWLGGGRIGFKANKFSGWYRLDYLNEDIYIPGKLFTTSYSAKDQDFITNRFTHQLQGDWQASTKLKVNASASYQDYKRSTETYIINYAAGTKTASTGAGEWDVSKFNSVFFRGTAQWFISDKLSLQPGLEYKRDNTSGERIAGSPTIADYSVFASAEIKPVEGLNIRPGLRFSKNSIYDAPPVIPSINVKIAIAKDVDLRVSYARGFRAPSLRELYFDFVDANHNIIGNTALKAEYSNSYNASIMCMAVNTNRLKVTSTLSGFYNDFNNKIDLVQVPGSTSNLYSYINISKYKTVGGTLENSMTWKSLQASLGVSYIGYYNQYKDDATVSGDHSSYTWSPEVNSNLTYSFTKLKAQLGFYYKFTGALPRYQLSSATTPATVMLSKVSSYNWADMTASKTLSKCITLQAGVKDLFNVTRLDNTSTDTGGAHSTGGAVLRAYGRSYFLSINFQWSKY